jgi:3-deoxy-D-manno-octulosonic-acid transferase
MLRALYSSLLYVFLPLVVLRVLWRGFANRGYWTGLSERLGRVRVEPTAGDVVWLHAVSVGEAQAAVPLVRDLLKTHPQLQIVVTTTTPTGRERVLQTLGSTRSVHVQFAPYDVPHAVGAFLRRVRPCLVIIMETEIWPNLLHLCAHRQVPVVLANARLSARSAARYQRIRKLIEPTLNCFSTIAAQTTADQERFQALGAKGPVPVTGSIKFDVQMPASVHEAGRALRRRWGEARAVFIAASTHDGEEEEVLEAFRLIRETEEDSLLVLVPRHPERFRKVEQLARKQGWTVACHSDQPSDVRAIAVYLGDTMGELSSMYAGADVAFVGGSLVAVGGHNMLEPAALGVPALFGPYLHNFFDIAAALGDAGAAFVVRSPTELATITLSLLQDANRRHACGVLGKAFVDENRGALTRTVALLSEQLGLATMSNS